MPERGGERLQADETLSDESSVSLLVCVDRCPVAVLSPTVCRVGVLRRLVERRFDSAWRAQGTCGMLMGEQGEGGSLRMAWAQDLRRQRFLQNTIRLTG